ncbi:MAG: HAMP domain-containing protein [Planctomycetes bacterium]|nr:HAMP domain-containing protein [Planctomycetota bacterium]
MFRSRFFWKLFGSYAILVLLTTLVVAYFVGRYMENAQWEARISSLQEQCVVMAPYARGDFTAVPDVGGAPWDVEIRTIAEVNKLRVTFIRRDGVVVLDTEENPDEMEDHRGRPEIQDALATGLGTSRRFGRTLDLEALYVAHVEKPKDRTNGVVRLSVPVSAIYEGRGKILARTVPGASLAALLALLLGYIGARRMTAPLGDLKEAATAFREGNYEQRIGNLSGDELGELGEAMNQLGAEVRSRVDRLSAERARLSAMLAGMAEGVLAVGEDDRILFSNVAAGDLLDLNVDEAQGSKLWDVLTLPGLLELISKARNSDKVVREELVFAQGGVERRFAAKAHFFQTDSSTGVVVVFEDITELRQLARVRQDFVANVSHELKTPLTSIQGYVETLLEGAVHDPDNNIRFLQKIDQNVHRLRDLVSDLLSLARIENQESRPIRNRVDLASIVESASQRFEQQLTKAGLELELQLEPEAASVWGDERGLIQVVDNLLSNAAKYTPEGGKLCICLSREDQSVHLQVKDTGVGIPLVDQDRIFERFYRVDKARSREVGGTGLGLSIVKHLVQTMQGRVGVESREGHGSTFHVHLEGAAGAAPDA